MTRREGSDAWIRDSSGSTKNVATQKRTKVNNETPTKNPTPKFSLPHTGDLAPPVHCPQSYLSFRGTYRLVHTGSNSLPCSFGSGAAISLSSGCGCSRCRTVQVGAEFLQYSSLRPRRKGLTNMYSQSIHSVARLVYLRLVGSVRLTAHGT